MDASDARLHLVGQTQALQALQAADQQQALALLPGFVKAFDHPARFRVAACGLGSSTALAISRGARCAGYPVWFAAPAIRLPVVFEWLTLWTDVAELRLTQARPRYSIDASKTESRTGT